MSTEKPVGSVSRDVVVKQLVETLEDMTSDWDIEFSGKIGEQTMLVGDLAFESIDVVHLIVTLGQTYEEKDLGFERILIEDGRYVSDLSVAQIADFLVKTLAEKGKI
jgi:acyl carrier protein